MSVSLTSIHDSDSICLNQPENTKTVGDYILPSQSGVKLNPPFSASTGELDSTEELIIHKKYPSSQDIRTSPFKEAVKGFVRNKLSKKVGNSHLLSGIIGKSGLEKIVRKLESEGSKDNKSVEEDKDVDKNPCIIINDEPIDETSNCELKSVVANVVSDGGNIDEASECFEEYDDLILDKADMSKITSISLPVTPVHRNDDSGSEKRHHSLISEDILAFQAEALQNLQFDTSDANDDFELSEMTDGKFGSTMSCISEPEEYLPNAYAGRESEDVHELLLPPKFIRAMSYMKSILKRVPIGHYLLLAALFIHNCGLLPCYVPYIFDAVAVAYICGSLLLEVPFPSKESPTSSICIKSKFTVDVQTSKKVVKGFVKILKGGYNPQKTYHKTDDAELTLENHMLTINPTGGHIGDGECYNLRGGHVSLLPKGLSKKRTFSTRFPICVHITLTGNTSSTLSDDKDTSGCDYVSLFPQNDALVEHYVEQVGLYLFPLTRREKEAWYRALRHACSLQETYDVSLATEREDFASSSASRIIISEPILSFDKYLGELLGGYQLSEETPKNCNVEWLNLLFGRLFYDFLTQDHWAQEVKTRIQKKLDKIEMPSFMEQLCVSEVQVGNCIPKFRTVGPVLHNTEGMWMDCDLQYNGSFSMTLNTRLRVESAHSSDTSEEDINCSKAQGKLLARIERWVAHRHFRNVAQSRLVRRYVGDLSNMPLTLTVLMGGLEGCLAINVPHPPTDRLWYGFRGTPTLALSVSPKVGAHRIHLSPVLQLIERKLQQAFERACVMPNMDDLVIPIMYSPVYED